MRSFLVLLIWLSGFQGAAAHEVRPAYMEIHQESASTLRLRLRQPVVSLGDNMMGGLDLRPVFPDACQVQSEELPRRAEGYLTRFFDVRCSAGFPGVPVRVEGLRRSLTDVYVVVRSESGEETSILLTAQSPEFVFGGEGPRKTVAFIKVGFDHMLGGLDHVLFVIGLILLVPRFLRLVSVATSFTIAHSLTLALSVTGLVRLPSAPVEAGIALSVLFLAYELSRKGRGASSIATRRPELVAFGFGLLHGFGFAGVLAEMGMPGDQLLPALLFFNIGVEIGQILVISIVTGVLALIGHMSLRRRDHVRAGLNALLTIGASYFFAGAVLVLIAPV